MLHSIEQMILHFGTPMVLEKAGQLLPLRAFLQQTRSRSKENSQREFGILGEVPKGLYVYIGPAEPEAAVGDVIHFQQRIFQLRRAEPMMVGTKTAYIWGLCVEKGGEGTWGS